MEFTLICACVIGVIVALVADITAIRLRNRELKDAAIKLGVLAAVAGAVFGVITSHLLGHIGFLPLFMPTIVAAGAAAMVGVALVLRIALRRVESNVADLTERARRFADDYRFHRDLERDD
jgi:hypothetical protein